MKSIKLIPGMVCVFNAAVYASVLIDPNISGSKEARVTLLLLFVGSLLGAGITVYSYFKGNKS